MFRQLPAGVKSLCGLFISSPFSLHMGEGYIAGNEFWTQSFENFN
jgi:hypothetical protein